MKTVRRPAWQETEFDHRTFFNYKGWGIRVSYGSKGKQIAGLTLYHYPCEAVTGADFVCLKCHTVIEKETLSVLSRLYNMAGIDKGKLNVPEEA